MDHGLRASELGLIRIEDWNQRANRIYFRRLKGSISQDYLLTSNELRALRAWIRGAGVYAAVTEKQRRDVSERLERIAS